MDRRDNDPRYNLHEPEQPREEERLSAEEYEEKSVEHENAPRAVDVRRGMDKAPPSEARERGEES